MKRELYEKVAVTCADLELPYYPKLLVVTMVYRKIINPVEKMDELMNNVIQDIVPELFYKHKKKKLMKISTEKELEELEMQLHNCPNIPEELLYGNVVSNTVRYYAQQVIGED